MTWSREFPGLPEGYYKSFSDGKEVRLHVPEHPVVTKEGFLVHPPRGKKRQQELKTISASFRLLERWKVSNCVESVGLYSMRWRKSSEIAVPMRSFDLLYHKKSTPFQVYRGISSAVEAAASEVSRARLAWQIQSGPCCAEQSIKVNAFP